MTTQELKSYIDRTLGNSIRCLLPSYWWKKMFGVVIDKVDEKLDSSALKTINGESIIGKGNLRVGVKSVESVDALEKLDAKVGDIASVGSDSTSADAYIKGETWTRLLKEGDMTGGESSNPIEVLYYRIQYPGSTKEHNAKVYEQMNSSFVRLLFNDGSRNGNEIFCGTYGCSYVKLEDYFFIHVEDDPNGRVFKLTSDGTLTFDHRETYADSKLSETSTNAVQNKAVYSGLANLATAVDDLRKDKDKSYVIITASNQSSMTCYDSTNRVTTVTLKPNIPTRVYTKRFIVSATSVIESIKLKHLDTSGVEDMSFMFYNGDALDNVSELDLSYFDTSLVTNMNHFVNLPKITKLDVTSFDTSNVTNMDEMFAGCAKLEELDVSLFKTHNVTSMYRVFGGCRELTRLNVSSFDTSKVTTMGSMFYNCKKLEEIDVTSFDTSNVTNMDGMFAGCQSLQYLDLSSFDTSNLDNTSRMQDMLHGCDNIQTLILGENFFKVKKEASVGNGLYGKAIYLVLPQWTNDSVITSLVNNSYDRISNGLDIITLYLSNNTKSVLTEEHLEIMNAKGYNLR